MFFADLIKYLITARTPIVYHCYNTSCMPKLIVTHRSPDLDAIASTWIFHHFLSATYADAVFTFVSAGETLPAEQAAQLGFTEKDVVHLDTGWGPFDHHQPERAQKRVCATSLAYEHLCLIQKDKKEDKALIYLVEYITQIDLFEDSAWKDADDMRYELMLNGILNGAKASAQYDDAQLQQFGFSLLNAAYAQLRDEFKALEIISLEGQSFKVGSVKAIALASSNGAVEKRAQKMGYDLMVRKNESKGDIRIKATPRVKNLDLTPVYERILKEDSVGTWFLHGSKRMLLNGSSKNPSQIPSPLSLIQVVKILKEELGET